MAVQTLSGVPSIVFGLFGSIFFVRFCHLGLSLTSGALTMVMMVLPLGIKTTQEALREVPASRREASYGLGAGKVRTIFRIVLPGAMPGILNGIVLSTGRIIGESAALIFTAGTLAKAAPDLLSSARTLAVHMYALSSEGLYIQQTYSTALVLLAVTIALNVASGLAGRLMKRKMIMNNKMNIQNVDLYYGKFQALKNISLDIPENEITALIGPSGCGKSTLLKCLNRMNDLVPGCRVEGSLLLDGQNIPDLPDVDLLRKEWAWFFRSQTPLI